MTAHLEITKGTKRYRARVMAGKQIIGQAFGVEEDLCTRRAVRQAYRWAEDRGWKLTIVRRQKT